MSRKKPRILFVCEEIKHYTVPFFRALSTLLKEDGVEMQIVYGSARRSEAEKKDQTELENTDPTLAKRISSFRLFGGRILYQSALFRALRSDLVIVDQGNRHVLNYLLILASHLGLVRVAFWGHGRNRQSTGVGFSELLKKTLLSAADHWFAYTSGTKRYLLANGVLDGKITVIQNSVDTEAFQKHFSSLSIGEVTAERTKLGVSEKSPVALYCGSLYPEKEIPVLLTAAREIKKVLPDFHLLVVGSGPDGSILRKGTRSEEWIHWLGPLFGKEKAVAFRLSHAFLHPGALGLAVLDSFVSGVPLITTENPFHGPEFEYLENGKTALILPHDRDAYSKGCVTAFSNPVALSALGENAKREAFRYGTDPMSRNYRDGILAALEIKPKGFL